MFDLLIRKVMETPVALAWDAPEAKASGERQLTKMLGITQFGVNHLTFPPGVTSARRHWHEREDEFVYVLSGTMLLRNENGDHELGPGSFVGFRAGIPDAHHLIGKSDPPAQVLVVGTRKMGEERVHYPDEQDPGPLSVVRDERGMRLPPRHNVTHTTLCAVLPKH